MRHRAPRSILTLTVTATLLAACGESEPASEATATTASQTPATIPATVPETTAAGAQTTDAGDGVHEHGEVREADSPLTRLVVADAASPSAAIIDLDDAGARHHLELAAPASLSSSISEDGRFLFAAHDDAVTVVDGGAWSEGHGDHDHHFVTDPVVVGDVAGDRPTHLISHGGTAALWFDGTGTATMLDEDELARGHVHDDAQWRSELAHHGFAVPYDDVVVTTEAEAEGEMPDTIVVAEDGTVTSEHRCTQTHGEATWAGGVAAACRDGVLVLDDTTWTSSLVAYPVTDDVDPYEYGPARAWALSPTADGERLVGAFGTRHVVVVEPSTASIGVIDLETEVAMFGVAIDDVTGHVLALTTDGVLRSVDLDTGATVDEASVLDPFTEGGEEEPYRQLVVADGVAYVADPLGSAVVEVDLTSWTQRSIDVGVTPAFIGLLGG